MVRGLHEGLAEAGFVEGDNLAIDYAHTEGHSERLAALAAGLVERRAPAIVRSGNASTTSMGRNRRLMILLHNGTSVPRSSKPRRKHMFHTTSTHPENRRRLERGENE
jgi:hypothetical protein